MPSPQHEAIVAALASQPKPETPPSIEESRAGMEAMFASAPLPTDLQCEPGEIAGVPAEWISVPGARDDAVVLYLHGGGYVMGSLVTHRELCGRVARATGTRVLSLDYRLAPEHAYPAAVEDATAAYRGLIAQGFEPGRIAIAGDSAGGGLTLATLAALSEAGDAMPAAAVCLSPWTDLELTGDSATSADDPMLAREGALGMAAAYLQGADARQPTASPLHADPTGFPPLLLLVGTREVLLDDSTRFAARAQAAGVDVTLEVGEGLVHVWPIFGAEVPESVASLEQIGAFIRKHTT